MARTRIKPVHPGAYLREVLEELPPPLFAELPEIVLLLMLSVPAERMPPPSLSEIELPEIVLLVRNELLGARLPEPRHSSFQPANQPRNPKHAERSCDSFARPRQRELRSGPLTHKCCRFYA